MKRMLAAPFVLTAVFSPVFADETAPPTKNPPPPKRQKLEPAPKDGNVSRNADGTCWYYTPEHCPPNVHCNPPPPRQVECPPEPPKKK